MRTLAIATAILGFTASVASAEIAVPRRDVATTLELRDSGARACRLNSQFTLVRRTGANDDPHNYAVTVNQDGSFTGASLDQGERVTGTFNGTTFTIRSDYATTGYYYTATGTVDPATGTITGSGTGSTGDQFRIIITNGATCTGGGGGQPTTGNCPAAPAVANAYLRERHIRGRTHGRIVSAVARHMGPGSSFDGMQPCDQGYAGAVRAYIDRQLARR